MKKIVIDPDDITSRIGLGDHPLCLPGTSAWREKYGDKCLEDVYERR